MDRIKTPRPTPLKPSRLPTCRTTRGRAFPPISVVGAVAVVALFAFAAWLDDDEPADKTREHYAVRLGGWLAGREALMQEMELQLGATVQDAYREGLAEGQREACGTAPAVQVGAQPGGRP